MLRLVPMPRVIAVFALVYAVVPAAMPAQAPIGDAHAASAAEDFVSHRAFYEMRLSSTESSSKIIGAEGRMAFEWREQCDGWAVQQHYLLEFTDAEGNVRDLSSRYSNYESKDGALYEFLVSKSGRATVEGEIKGSAERSDPSDKDGPGIAAFEKPETVRFDLANGTLFPSAHTFALINAAEAGTTFFPSRIFDGSEVEPESVVTAVIGKKAIGSGAVFDAANGEYWPIRLAFFDPAGGSPLPTYEMDVDLLRSGVARSLTLDYGSYEIEVTLVDLVVFDDPGC